MNVIDVIIIKYPLEAVKIFGSVAMVGAPPTLCALRSEIALCTIALRILRNYENSPWNLIH